MRIAIISDIHANIEALEAVLKKIEEIKVDRILCLGDIIGYGPNPNECISLVKEIVDESIVGNHEYGVLGRTDLRYFSLNARLACEWTRDVLTEENLEYISELPVNLIIDDMLLVHSTPHLPLEWNYILNIRDAVYQFMILEQKICFIGHSHEPVTFIKNERGCEVASSRRFIIGEGCKYIINCGSVGQPRDYDPRAAFGFIDIDKGEVQIIRVPYDIKKVQEKIIRSGLPRFLADRLSMGA